MLDGWEVRWWTSRYYDGNPIYTYFEKQFDEMSPSTCISHKEHGVHATKTCLQQ